MYVRDSRGGLQCGWLLVKSVRLLRVVQSVRVRSGVVITGGGGNSLLGRLPIIIPHGPKTPPNLVTFIDFFFFLSNLYYLAAV